MGTGIRNKWRVGHYLLVDDESGLTYYDDQITERWDGLVFRERGNEDEVRRHPQEYVRALDDPRPVSPIRPVENVTAYVPKIDADLVGNTNVQLPTGAAQHLFITSKIGIGEMAIVDASAITCARAFTVRSG